MLPLVRFFLPCYLNYLPNTWTTCESPLSPPLDVTLLDVAYLQESQLKALRDSEVNICCQPSNHLRRDRKCFLVKKTKASGDAFSRCLSDEWKQNERVCASFHPGEWKVWLNIHFFLSSSPHQRRYLKMGFPVKQYLHSVCQQVQLSDLFSFLNLLLYLCVFFFCRGSLHVSPLPRDAWLSKRNRMSTCYLTSKNERVRSMKNKQTGVLLFLITTLYFCLQRSSI